MMRLNGLGGCVVGVLLCASGTEAAVAPASVAEAVKKMDKAAIRALVQKHADVNVPEPDGSTALHWAAYTNDFEIADLLIKAGADPNIADNDAGMGPLYAAMDMHRLAIGHGRGTPLPTGLLTAVDVARSLLEHGAVVDAQLKKPIMQRTHTFGDGTLGAGTTPLLRAAKSGDIEMVRLLLAAGADPKHTLENGTTAFMLAAGLGWRNGSPIAPSYDQGPESEAIETLELLLGLGLDVRAATATGDTALHGAVGRPSETLVKFLLEHGADPLAANARKQTPLSMAETRGTPAMAQILRNAAPTAAASATAPAPAAIAAAGSGSDSTAK